MYIQVNEKAPLEQQIKQLKTQLEIILDNLELGATATGDSLPEGGTDGQVLTKQTDGSADWEDPTGGAAANGLPSGGATDQILAKNSNDNYDGKWVNPYTHPASHSPSIILEDENNRFVTDAEITAWNAKQAALGFTPEDAANKKTSLAENSDTYYPTQKAVKTAVDGKSDTGHGHAISDVTDLSTTLSGKAASSHGHAIGDVTDLSTTLAGIAALAKPFVLDATTTTEGIDRNATSGLSYTSMTALLTVYKPVKITHIYWDIKKAGTYTLKMFNQTIATEVTLPGDDNADVEFALTTPIVLTPGDHKIWLYSGLSVVWDYNNGADYFGTFWEESSSLTNGSANNILAPIKIKAYVGSWNIT